MKVIIKTWIISAVLLLLLPVSAIAQSMDDKAAVLATMDRFFLALAESDRVGLETTTLSGSLFVAASVDNSGQESITTSTREQLVTALSNPQNKRLERYWDATVLVRENIALFWAPYDFHVDGEFSHCGIDSFQLFKIDGQWLIGSSSYTRERTGCAASPLGPIE